MICLQVFPLFLISECLPFPWQCLKGTLLISLYPTLISTLPRERHDSAPRAEEAIPGSYGFGELIKPGPSAKDSTERLRVEDLSIEGKAVSCGQSSATSVWDSLLVVLPTQG